MTALLDGDIIAYRCAASCEKKNKEGGLVSLEPVEVAIMRIDTLMRDILSMEDNHLTFIKGKNNFRYKIYPEYKANRKKTVPPVHLQACYDFLKQEYSAIEVDGYEVDDALGIHQDNESVIFSIDKDLLMIPGCHFNFVTRKYMEVSELDGLKTFYKQMLIGDVSDNIFGIDGIGKVKAAKLIDNLETEEEMYKIVRELYYPVPTYKLIEDEERFYINADCLWIMQKEGETFSKRYENISSV